MIDQVEIGGITLKADAQGGCWDGKIELAGWNADGSALRMPIRIEAQVDGEGPKQEKPTAEQVAAVQFLLENGQQVSEEILAEALAYASEYCQEDDLMDESIETIDDLRDSLESPEILIQADAVDSVAWYALGASVEWDMEHDFGIALWKDLVLEIGHADVTFSTPSGYVYRHGSAEREELRDHIVDSLEKMSDAREDAALAAYFKELSPDAQLVIAICADEDELTQELIAKGADINASVGEFPPAIFHAMETQDPETVQRMIEAGARLDVQNELGMTPTQWAEQMLLTCERSDRVRSGDMGAMNEMLKEFMGDDDNPLKSIMNDLQSMQGQGGLVGDAAEGMTGMIEKLMGGMDERMAQASEQEREYLQQVQEEGESFTDNWRRIAQLIQDAEKKSR